MPEYLAPGVYVEETSFRAKSIEGVSTSTTAFVGLARRGPVGRPQEDGRPADVPELVTSFADFGRVYGGLEDINGRPNYLAHAVRAYFNEGGARLYVSRVAMDDAQAAAAEQTVATGAGGTLTFVARFPGTGGNGTITLLEQFTPATLGTMQKAKLGTLLRVGGAGTPATSAALAVPGAAPFRAADGETLELDVDGTPVTVTFQGEVAEVTGAAAIDFGAFAGAADADRTFQVTINGGATQRVLIPGNVADRQAIVDLLNRELRGAYADLTAGDELTVGTERRGSTASVTVPAQALFGFTAEESAANAADADNNFADLDAITVADLDAALAPDGVRVTQTAGGVRLSTVAAGAVTLTVTSAPASLGLAGGATATGAAGDAITWFVKESGGWVGPSGSPDLSGLSETQAPAGGADFVTMHVQAADADGSVTAYEDVAFARTHPRWIGNVLAKKPARRADQLEQMYAVEETGAGVTAIELRNALFGAAGSHTVGMRGGTDGGDPNGAAYEAALEPLKALDDISIVAGPGHSAFDASWEEIQRALINFVERERAYQILVLDTPPERTVGGAREVRSRIDSTKAALYFPWVVVGNPLSRPGRDDIPREIKLPPSGFVAGIYARNDVQRGVHKAPANEVVRGALRFETDVNFAEQGVLNPIGVNCLRFFPGRGFRVWGARTVSSDPEWKYVNVRRYFNYLERSIDQGTQWAVFEPNGERLWANVRETISSFLYNEWRNGALLGGSAKEAYFVKCDRSTMTQNDLDNGRLICLIGVAVLKPAEFVIFRIGQKTADARS